MARKIILAEGTAEQAHIGRTGLWSWLAVRGNDGIFLSMPHIAGQSGKLVWFPDETEEKGGHSTED